MNFGKNGDKKGRRIPVGMIRKTQLVSTFATGAIAEMPEYTVVMAASNNWEGRKLYEPNLQRLLGMSYFMEPEFSESQSPLGNADMLAIRFPQMHFCPKCGKLDNYKSFGDPKNKKCAICNREIVPSRFITVCINGHLEDFPFEWWVHYGNVMNCKEPTNHHKLTIEFKDSTGGLASIVIKCKECGKERSMEGCMSPKALNGYKCRGKRPWISMKEESNDPLQCTAPMRALQRGASNAYYSITQSALTIPPWSHKLQEEIESKWSEILTGFEGGMDDNFLTQLINIFFKDSISSGKYSASDYMGAIKKRRGLELDEDSDFTEKKMYEDEYRALCAGYGDNESEETEQFCAEITNISPFLQDYFDEVVLVKRLREVMAFRGFRRLTPSLPNENEDAFKGVEPSREIMPPWDKPLKWLPAIEMRGEGIFVVLNKEKLEAWENKNAGRYDEMKKRIGNLKIGKDMFSARYVLLHTLSHLLIRQLTIDCGYQEAALKERIYSTYPENGNIEMAGILIYTSSSDSDGSLGGLVRQGESDLLEETMRNLLEEASWCSSDPLCIESKSQGFNSLNYAACHACTLLPETSCEARNCLLDRAAVVGKPDEREIGYFGQLLLGGINNG